MVFDDLICIEGAILDGPETDITKIFFADSISMDESNLTSNRMIPIMNYWRDLVSVDSYGISHGTSHGHKYEVLRSAVMNRVDVDAPFVFGGVSFLNSASAMNRNTIISLNGFPAEEFLINDSIIWKSEKNKIKSFHKIHPANSAQELLVALKWKGKIYEFTTDEFPYCQRITPSFDIEHTEDLDKLIDDYKHFLDRLSLRYDSNLSYTETVIQILSGAFSQGTRYHVQEAPTIELIEIYKTTEIIGCSHNFGSNLEDCPYYPLKHPVFPGLRICIDAANKYICLESQNLLHTSHNAKNDVDYDTYEKIEMGLRFATFHEFDIMINKLKKYGEIKIGWGIMPTKLEIFGAPDSIQYKCNNMYLEQELDWSKELDITLFATQYFDRN